MDIHFNEQQKMLQEVIREFVATEVAPNAAKWDEEDYCPVELMPVMGELGILGIWVPEQYGGAGLGHVERVMFIEEIARHSAGLAMMVFTHQLGMGAILDFGTEEQKMKWLPDMCAGTKCCGLAVTEPGGGSDVGGQKTTAVLEDGQWVVNGRKCFITNSHTADVSVITAKTGEDEKGRAQFSAIVFEKGMEGFGPGRKEHKFGLRGSTTGDLVMTDAKTPAENIIGKPGQGTAIAMKEIGEIGRASMSAIGVGLLRACVEDAVKFANERIIYGKPLAKIPAIQVKIADNRINYEAARALLYKAACLKDEGVPTTVPYGISKFFAVEAAVKAAKNTMDLMGGYGSINEYPVSRYLRDAMVSIPSGGTSDIQQVIIAGDTLKNF